MSVTFDTVYGEINDILKQQKLDLLPVTKRNNQIFEDLKVKYKDNADIVNGLNMLISYNNILFVYNY